MKLTNFKFIGRCRLSKHSVTKDAVEGTVDMTTGYLWWKKTRSLHVICPALGYNAIGRWVVRHRVNAPRISQIEMYALYNDFKDKCFDELHIDSL